MMEDSCNLTLCPLLTEFCAVFLRRNLLLLWVALVLYKWFEKFKMLCIFVLLREKDADILRRGFFGLGEEQVIEEVVFVGEPTIEWEAFAHLGFTFQISYTV